MTTLEVEHTAPSANRQADFHVLHRDKVCLAVPLMLNEIMDWELEAVIAAALMSVPPPAVIIGTAIMSVAWSPASGPSHIVLILTIEPAFGQFCRYKVQRYDPKNDRQIQQRQRHKAQQSSQR